MATVEARVWLGKGSGHLNWLLPALVGLLLQSGGSLGLAGHPSKTDPKVSGTLPSSQHALRMTRPPALCPVVGPFWV
jgi:hypothetical protein